VGSIPTFGISAQRACVPARGNGQTERMEGVRVLVVDDSEPARAAIADVVAATNGFVVAGCGRSGAEALELLPQLDPDLVLLDVQMPGLSGPETASRISDKHPETSIVFVSADPGLAELVEPARFLAKSELSPGRLREVWRATRANAAAPSGEARQLRRNSQSLRDEAQVLIPQAEQQVQRSNR
jgi:CheY-like chemotaxis protein